MEGVEKVSKILKNPYITPSSGKPEGMEKLSDLTASIEKNSAWVIWVSKTRVPFRESSGKTSPERPLTIKEMGKKYGVTLSKLKMGGQPSLVPWGWGRIRENNQTTLIILLKEKSQKREEELCNTRLRL